MGSRASEEMFIWCRVWQPLTPFDWSVCYRWGKGHERLNAKTASLFFESGTLFLEAVGIF